MLLYQNSLYSDFLISHGDKYITCHRPILAGMGFFLNIFKYNPNQDIYEIKSDEEFKVVELMVQIAYGVFDYKAEFLPIETLVELFAGCNFYDYEYGKQIASYQLFNSYDRVKSEYSKIYQGDFDDLVRKEYWTNYRGQFKDMYNNPNLSDIKVGSIFAHSAIIYEEDDLPTAYGLNVTKASHPYLVGKEALVTRTQDILSNLKELDNNEMTDEIEYIAKFAKLNRNNAVLEVLSRCDNNPLAILNTFLEVLDSYYISVLKREKAIKVVRDSFPIPNCKNWSLAEIVFIGEEVPVSGNTIAFINEYFDEIQYLIFEQNGRKVQFNLHMFDDYLPELERRERDPPLKPETSSDSEDYFWNDSGDYEGF